MAYFLKFLKPYRWQVLLSSFLVFCQVVFSLQTPKIAAHIVNQGILKGDVDFILQGFLQVFIFFSLSMLISFINIRLATQISVNFYAEIQRAVIRQVLEISRTDINKIGVSSLVTRSISDIRTLRRLVDDFFISHLWAIITAIWIVVEAVSLAPSMSWIILVSALAALLIIPVLMYFAVPKIKIYRKLIDQLSGIIRSNISGSRVIRAFNRQATEKQRFTRNNQDIIKYSLKIDYIFAVEGPFIGLTYNLVSLLCAWVGISMLQADINYLGIITAFMSYAMRIIGAFITISSGLSFIPRANISAGRLKEILKIKPSITWRSTTLGNPAPVSDVQFKQVTFRFHDADQDLLKNISFTAKAGQTTAFIGSTGCGKTTLVELILRLHDVTAGEILVGGLNIKNYAKADLMRKIGYIPQKGVLFSGTIAENIRFGTESATAKEIKDAAKLAMIHQHIESLPKKYQTMVSQTGKNFSGGQKQRLSIARALVKQPEILIFDDAFSALDTKTDLKLRTALKSTLQNTAKLIVAQRINTIKDADQIIVLEQGKIVGKGKHLELLKSCQVYQDIVKSQYSPDKFQTELSLAAGVAHA